MNFPNSTLQFACWAIAAVAVLISWITFDGFVKRLHKIYFSLWESLGKPSGWIYAPNGKAFNSSGIFSQIIFTKPTWISDKPDLILLRHRLQISLSIFLLASVTWITSTVLSRVHS